MLNKCTALQPIAVSTAIVASTGVQVVSASIDPNLNHFDYYNQLLSSDCGNVSASAALACARAYVNFVSINATSMGGAREACDHLHVEQILGRVVVLGDLLVVGSQHVQLPIARELAHLLHKLHSIPDQHHRWSERA